MFDKNMIILLDFNSLFILGQDYMGGLFHDLVTYMEIEYRWYFAHLLQPIVLYMMALPWSLY